MTSTDLTRPRRTLVLRQSTSLGEIASQGLFTARNRLDILGEGGHQFGTAVETGRGFRSGFWRSLAGRFRSCTIDITGAGGEPIAQLIKPFSVYFHCIEVFDGARKLGAVRRRFGLLERRFSVEDASGNEVLRLQGPILKPWTFRILNDHREVGLVRKKWSGGLRELLSDSDAFGLEFEEELELDSLQPLLIAATLLVDFTSFEGNQPLWFDWFLSVVH